MTRKTNTQTTNKIDRLRLPNDKVAKRATDCTADEYARSLQDDRALGALEVELPRTVSYFKFAHVEGFDDMTPLNFRDRYILSACVAAYESGLRALSLNQICRAVMGDKSNRHVPARLREAVLESLKKMMGVRITIDFTETRKLKGYKKLPARIHGVVLPCRIVEDELINGQRADMVYLSEESPLMTCARLKGQVLTIDSAILAVPNLRNTPCVMDLKGYVTFRVLEIVRHKMTPSITFADVFAKCGLKDAVASVKQDARATILKTIESLKEKGEIGGFEVIRRGAYHSVRLLPKPAAQV